MKMGMVVEGNDGLQSILTGVGVVVNAFVDSFHEIKEKTPLLAGHNVELICISPFINKKSSDYHQAIRELTSASCKRNNGRLIEIQTASDGSSQQSIWGGPEQWKSASESLAQALRSLVPDYDKIYVFAHDTIFALTRYYLRDPNNVHIVWIPHSLGKIFEKESPDYKRLTIEAEGIQSLNKTKGDYIGYIGNSFKRVLHSLYKIPLGKLIPFTNGLYLASSRYRSTMEEEQNILSHYRIPLNKKLIFSWGRCVPQKGFDIIIPAYKKFYQNAHEYHLVLLMPIETSDAQYLAKIKNQLNTLPPDSVTPIFQFDLNLPYAVLKNMGKGIIVLD